MFGAGDAASSLASSARDVRGRTAALHTDPAASVLTLSRTLGGTKNCNLCGQADILFSVRWKIPADKRSMVLRAKRRGSLASQEGRSPPS